MSIERDEKERKALRAAIERKFASRITIAKDGRKYFLEKEYGKAAQRYHEYLESLSNFKELPSIYNLKPTHFDKDKDVAEMLLISNIFWELARIYDMTPKLQGAFEKCLNQFVAFTVNQKFQVLNSEMLRKFIKNNKYKIKQYNKMNEAYGKIQSESKGCFIATECFGPDSIITNDIRLLKPVLLKYKFGQEFVRLYYSLSTKFIYSQSFPRFKKSLIKMSKPPLYIFSKVIRLIRGFSK